MRAVNKAGPGDPCDHGKSYKIQAKPGLNFFFKFSKISTNLAAPAFTSGGIQDQRLRVGETIKYEVGIAGEPLPAVSWEVDGKPLKVGMLPKFEIGAKFNFEYWQNINSKFLKKRTHAAPYFRAVDA